MYDLFVLIHTEIQFSCGHFSVSAMECLAAEADINICFELAPKCHEMIEKLSLPQSISHNRSPINTIMVVFNEWLAGKTSLPPTWSKMMVVLREIEMTDLAVRIERYLGTTSENGLFLRYETLRFHAKMGLTIFAIVQWPHSQVTCTFTFIMHYFSCILRFNKSPRCSKI